ncbi:hypothetical protein RSAG8_13727, partial [Rhizoctonia solani AG-8 WAC10335]
MAIGEEYLYTQLLSYDGSFQLVCKNKAINQFDTSLTNCLMYFVEQQQYQAHLITNKDTAYSQGTKAAGECNNHRAANDTWVRQSGVVETGLGAVTCARHTVFMPQGCVNYWKGECYVYMDYAIGSVMQTLMQEGASDIGVFYDIFCQWGKNLWSRTPQIQLPAGPLTHPARFFGGVPKYHLAAHNDACYAQYSLNNMFGIGHLDAEGCEHVWANLNGTSGSTSEKGPGAWTDSLNYCMNDWNWRKMVSMVMFLLKKWKEVVRLSAEMEEAWDVVNDSIPVALSTEWETLSTEPRLVNRKWTSVFLMDDSAALSHMHAVLDLNTIESERIICSGSSEPGFMVQTWLSEGFDIEHLQSHLRQDVHSYGMIMSSWQLLDVYNHRSALLTWIQLHREHSTLFIDVKIAEAGSLQSLAEETDGKPEHAGLYLPSQLMTRLSSTKCSERVIVMEKMLRKAECLEMLQ